ncbi:hypothetical protein SAMN04487951_101245 [Vreelandella arcis]|uniref:Uncharacterized protein n=1 Tax=Vreelandella arcis TaxID=416873 RepID=A0A1G9XEI9_9GAMM|nr:hypothetical protein SAMN04487951_101245 [Halomonas arcis]
MATSTLKPIMLPSAFFAAHRLLTNPMVWTCLVLVVAGLPLAKDVIS